MACLLDTVHNANDNGFMVDVLTPQSDEKAVETEALFREAKQRARRRAIRRLVAIVLVVVALAAVVAVVVTSRGSGHSGPAPAVGPTRTTPGLLPQETLQFRPVLATSEGSCRAADIREDPGSRQTVSLPAPSGPLPGVRNATGTTGTTGQGCALLGPSVLSTSKVAAVELGRSPASFVFVMVVMDRSDVARLRLATGPHPARFYAVVGLGQVLSYPTGSQLSTIGPTGQFQVAGGLSTGDLRPRELSDALRARLVEMKPPAGSPSLQF